MILINYIKSYYSTKDDELVRISVLDLIPPVNLQNEISVSKYVIEEPLKSTKRESFADQYSLTYGKGKDISFLSLTHKNQFLTYLP